jgi:hypothetical protein
MKLEWTDKEVVFISDVGTVGPGTIFEIEDSRGQDLVSRGAARLVHAEVKKLVEKRDIKVIVADGLGVGDR